MTRKLFGTDGIRGAANTEPMTAETAMKVAMATALQFRNGDHRHLVVIGKDTRLSGYMLEPALTAGFISMGMDVILVGPMPTPAVAMLIRSLRADMGVVISASHNPFEDNGIKLFGPDAYKLSDDVEAAIERRMAKPFSQDLVSPGQLGKARRLEDASGRYVEYVKSTLPRGLRLDGLKIVVDCAHGAAYKVAPTVLWELGAEVIPLGVQPTGTNINQNAGVMAPRFMADKVVEVGADLGVALDGDADRVLFCDERGAHIDGDQIMALIAEDWAQSGRLKGGGVVATVMSNLGLERCLQANGLSLVRTPVGDRYVVEHMRNHGFNLGGEQSGHIVLGDHSTTGDGLIAALQVLAVLQKRARAASEVTRPFVPVPQILKNVRYRSGDAPLESGSVKAVLRSARQRLGDDGRLVVRKSGTEAKIRVMAEADDTALITEVVDEICAAVQRISTPDSEVAAE